MKKILASLLLGLGWIGQVRGEAMLQLFNVSWKELTAKMPELAEAGYASLWLPPPTKASSAFDVGYGAFDPFDLGDKDQRGTIRTRYGTREELLQMIRTAHRFGLRVYFDNIMNHRAFDVPGYDENTPITLYPGMLPEDFHLRVTPDGFFRKWDNTRDWNNVWQVQNLGLADLIDISQEDPNANFGPVEGTAGNPKLRFVRHPKNPEYYDFHPTLGRVGFGNVTQADLDNNPEFYKEDVGGYLMRAVRWLIDTTKCDGLRLDAVKHVPSYFFGKQFGADKDTSDDGYTGQIQRQFNITHGYSDANHRDTVFDAEAARDDALVFGEHLGEPPSFSEYIDAGMRLVDNNLRSYLNDVLGNPWRTLAGLDQRDFGGFSAAVRVMHAQSHDNDFAARRELQNALYFMKEGIPNIYSDGYNKSQTCRDCGGAFPRHANAPYLGQFGDNKMPDLAWLHGNLARGGTRPRWSDADIVAFERYEYREGIPDPFNNPHATVVLFAMNDNYAGDISFDDGVAQTTAGTYYECFPVTNNRGVGLVVGFPPGSVLAQLADSPNKERACSKLLVRVATNDKNYAEATKNDPNPVNRAVWVGSQAIPPGGGAIELKIPSGGYVIYSYEPPQPSRPIGGVLSNSVITLVQDGKPAPRMFVRRTDGVDGDPNFNPIYPFLRRGSIDINGNPIGGQNVSNLTYAIDIPVLTNNTPFDIIVRTDGSSTNALVKLDGGIDLDSHMGRPPLTGLDRRNNKPGSSIDMFLGYEDTVLQTLNGPEKFAARDVARNTVVSIGAETYLYTIGGTTSVVNGTGGGATIDTQTADWVFHNPPAAVDGVPNTKHREPLEPAAGQAVTNWVKVGYQFQINKGHIYYTTDGTNPEGAFGVGAGTTQVVPLQFSHTTTQADGVIDWWRGVIPGQPAGTTVKYKIALYKQGATTISDADPAKYYAVRQSAVTNFNPQTAVVWLHNNLNTNHTAIGLEEGFHILRARAFLPRDGKSSIYNTFMQTFYYDPAPPDGAIAFPTAGETTFFSRSYGIVVRADPTVIEVEYNIVDSDPANDSPENGNGVGFWAKATEVSPWPGLNSLYPNFPREYRFNYVGIPSSGTATITVRLKELTSSAFPDRVKTITRVMNCAAPPIVFNIRCPDIDCFGSDQRNIFLDQNDSYQIVTCFSSSLNQAITNFTIKVDGSVQARFAADGSPLYFINDEACEPGTRALRYNWRNMSAGSHLIEVFYDHDPDGIHVQDSAIVNVSLTGISVNIIQPPDADAAGRSPFTIVLPDKTNALPQERQFTIITETSPSVTNVNISFDITTNAFSGGTAELDTNFVGSTRRWNFLWTNMVAGTFVIRADATGGGSNTAFRTVRVAFQQIVSADPDDDDDDDDGISDLLETTPQPLPTTNPESWVNSDVHKYFFSGRTDPLNVDSDNDGLPDGLELGIGPLPAATNTNTSADFNGDGFPNFIPDADPPKYNTFDNSSLSGFDPNRPRTDLIRGSVTDPNNPDTDYDNLGDGTEDANRNGRVDIGLTNATGQVTSIITTPPIVRNSSRVDPTSLPANAVFLETDPNNADTDGDGLFDGTEDINKNGHLDIGLLNCSPLPCTGTVTGMLAYADIPHLGNNITGIKSRAINRAALAAAFPNAVWLETDPLDPDTDRDGLPDGWEVRYAFDPHDNGTFNMRTGSAGDPVNGPDGDPDNDGFTNLQEYLNGTNPRESDITPPPPADSVVIGPGPDIGSASGVAWKQEFQDWRASDLKALDEYDGAGFLKRGRDVYPRWDGYDYSRDIVAFYARDGGADGRYYFRLDFHDLAANAEQGFLDFYILINFGTPGTGEINLPDEVDGKTAMGWKVAVAGYHANSGTVYVRLPNGTVQARGFNPTGTGFLGSYYRGDLDSVELAISRQALIDAGWNGASPLFFQVYTTKDGTQNSACGGNPCGGDIGGRIDITDSIYDDDIAESDTQAPGDTLNHWFTSINHNPVNLSNWSASINVTNRPNAVKLAVVLHGNQAVLPASLIHNLLSNAVTRTPAGSYAPLDPGNQPTGYYRALETHDVFNLPVNLHLSGSLISALQWAKTDPALDPTGSRDGVKFNQRIKTLIESNKAALVSGMFADHIAPYFTGAVNRTAIQLQNQIMRHVYGENTVSASTPLWLAERVVDGPTLSDLAANSGHTHLLLDQLVHLWWWADQLYGFPNGRIVALGNSGYQINQFNGMKTFMINAASDQMYLNHDLGPSLALRQLLIRKALSGTRDQIVILADNWETTGGVGGTSNPDKWNLVVRWLANHQWIKPVTLDKVAANQVDMNNDGTVDGNDTWFVHNRGTANFSQQAKDLIRHNCRGHYDNWYYGLAGAEESFFDKFPPLRSGVFGSKKLGHVLTNGTVLADAWFDAQAASGSLSNLARLVYLAGIFKTAFHDEDNNNFERFSTGEYKFPDTTGFDPLSAFAAKPNSRQTRQAGIVAAAAAWAASNPSTATVATQQDVDHDGEAEYILYNNRLYAVFESGGAGKSLGGRLIAAFARDPATGHACQMIGNPVSTPEFETEAEGNFNLSGGTVFAYRTSGFKDWWAVTNINGTGTAQYVNDLYNVTPLANGFQFSSSDGKITKTITLAADSDKLEAGYSLSGGVIKLYTRHGLSPDLLDLLFNGQKNLLGPTVAGGKVAVVNSNSAVIATASLAFADTGHSGSQYNAAATDDGGGTIVALRMRNQAHTHQIELESTATRFNFALQLSVVPAPSGPADSDGDGLPDDWETAHGLDPNDPTGNNGATGDPDGDGMTNIEEYMAGTHPNDAGSVLRIVSITPAPGGYQIEWLSVPGKNYQLWVADEAAGPYTCISGCPTIPASAGSTTSYLAPATTDARKFYKVKLVP